MRQGPAYPPPPWPACPVSWRRGGRGRLLAAGAARTGLLPGRAADGSYEYARPLNPPGRVFSRAGRCRAPCFHVEQFPVILGLRRAERGWRPGIGFGRCWIAGATCRCSRPSGGAVRCCSSPSGHAGGRGPAPRWSTGGADGRWPSRVANRRLNPSSRPNCLGRRRPITAPGPLPPSAPARTGLATCTCTPAKNEVARRFRVGGGGWICHRARVRMVARLCGPPAAGRLPCPVAPRSRGLLTPSHRAGRSRSAGAALPPSRVQRPRSPPTSLRLREG